ncbi:MAG: hypothetical protein IPH95_20820 [Candidatus Promineofilum sp.]|nr:hypothetical protein [Promineifilum sp.]
MQAYQLKEGAAVEHEVLSHDLTILEDMVLHMGGYLLTEATRWDVGKSGAPPITVGGYLMRRRRLGLLAGALGEDERRRLAAANADYDATVARQLVRYEARALAEAGARMREWADYLRDLATSKRLAGDHAHYAYKADIRVVLDEVLDLLGQPPYRRPEHVLTDVAALDHRLQGRWQPGAFVWAAVWQPAYSVEKYWWLYGHLAA